VGGFRGAGVKIGIGETRPALGRCVRYDVPGLPLLAAAQIRTPDAPKLRSGESSGVFRRVLGIDVGTTLRASCWGPELPAEPVGFGVAPGAPPGAPATANWCNTPRVPIGR